VIGLNFAPYIIAVFMLFMEILFCVLLWLEIKDTD